MYITTKLSLLVDIELEAVKIKKMTKASKSLPKNFN